jgi:hypothetical protein
MTVVERRGVGRRIIEAVRNVEPLDVINKIAVAGMLGAFGEAGLITPNNPDPGMAVAISLFFIAVLSGVPLRIGSQRIE